MLKKILMTVGSLIILTVGMPVISYAQESVLTIYDYKRCMRFCNESFKDGSQKELECVKGCTSVRALVKETFLLFFGVYESCIKSCHQEFGLGNQEQIKLECFIGCREARGN